MSKILIFLFILSSQLCFSQTLNDLDVKKGFRNFKFGMNPSQFNNLGLENINFNNNSKVKIYIYYGDDIEYVCNIKVDEIRLLFFEEKLCSITIDFGNFVRSEEFKLQDYEKLLSYLEQTYGKDWVIAKKKPIIINGVIWDATKVRLELFRLDLSKEDPKKKSLIRGYIHIFDKNLMNKIYSSEF